MGAYLDRLNTQYDEILEGIDEILDRAADENRDATEDEEKLVEREQAKAEELKKSIEHYAALEVNRAKVNEVRSKVPAVVTRSTTKTKDEQPAKVEDLFRSAGEYATVLHRATHKREQDAIELIQRATEHQTTADNPGLIPRPLVGPIITAVGNERPFIQSITNQPLPTGAFDRPKVTQHVAVGKQTAEKSPTDSRKLLIEKLPVSAATYAGHLNVSLQDIRWTQPGVMQVLFEDFGHEYAKETDEDAVTQFEASIAEIAPVPVASDDAAAYHAAIFAAAGQIMTSADGAPLPDTIWVAPDVWGKFGSLTGSNGNRIFPSVTPTDNTGNPMGLRMVVDPWFTAGTAVVGVSRYLEWYEDVAGFLTVAEPDVLGQLVGYAGFGAFLNTEPKLFVPLTMPTDTPAVQSSSRSSK